MLLINVSNRMCEINVIYYGVRLGNSVLFLRMKKSRNWFLLTKLDFKINENIGESPITDPQN